MGEPSTSDLSSQLQIRLITKQEQYSVADTPFAVPSTIKHLELNNLVNELLKESLGDELKKKIEFDFLAGGEFIRTPLGVHIGDRGLSSEAVIDVEYVERLPSPQPKDCLIHDDWVASVHAHDKWILTGCYDNLVHIWTTKGKHKLRIPGHTNCVKAVAWIFNDGSKATFASASHDQTAIIWEWNIEENIVECVHMCRGHTKGIECLGVSKDGDKFATGGWDNMLKVWSADVSEHDHEGQTESKKTKVDDDNIPVRTPILTMQGHKEVISAICWSDTSEMITASWDHTLKWWDVEIGNISSEVAGNKAFFDVHLSPFNSLALTASADRHVRLYDPRSSEGSLVKSTFTSHEGWVQTVRWSSGYENHFISGSYDQSVKLWDTRSPQVPLFDLSGHTDKVLCCDWTNPDFLLSGGCDNSLRIFKSRKAMPS